MGAEIVVLKELSQAVLKYQLILFCLPITVTAASKMKKIFKELRTWKFPTALEGTKHNTQKESAITGNNPPKYLKIL